MVLQKAAKQNEVEGVGLPLLEPEVCLEGPPRRDRGSRWQGKELP